MKNKYGKGFFLSETMVVLAVVAIILISIFKIFSTTYIKFQESENYNTVNSINALANVKKYFESFGEIDAESLLEDNAYVDLTSSANYASEYYDSIKEEYDIDSVYLFNMSTIRSNLSNFNVLLRKYIESLPDSNKIILLVNVKGNQFTSVSISKNLPSLIGIEENEYAVYLNPGEEFIDPGYINWEGEPPITSWESSLNINAKGIYYLIYNFDNYIIRRKVQVIEREYNFDYSGDVQPFTIPETGLYEIELWGAQGGDAKYSTQYYGGKGGYTAGKILLNKNEIIYLYIGGQGASVTGTSSFTVTYNGDGYNGGTPATANASNTGGGGGGATDIRYGGTTLEDRIMVAGGGGGAKSHSSKPSYSGTGGAGGGLIGENAVQGNATCYAYGTGGTQVLGGNSIKCTTSGKDYTEVAQFGQGASSYIEYTVGGNSLAGGGGGYYGGGAGYHAAAGGGSSFISGYTGSVAVTSEGIPKLGCTDGTTDNLCSIHYSNKVFTDSTMIAGNEEMPTHDDTPTMIGNEGNGYIKITLQNNSN